MLEQYVGNEIYRQLLTLNQSDKEIDDLYHRFVPSWGLSETALWITYVVSVHGEGCTQKEICESWSYSSQTVNSALRGLEAREYLRLAFTVGDRKSKKIMLTEKG